MNLPQNNTNIKTTITNLFLGEPLETFRVPWADSPGRNVRAVPLLIFIPEVPSSSLSWDTDYPDWGFRGFPQFLQANAGITPSDRPQQ